MRMRIIIAAALLAAAALIAVLLLDGEEEKAQGKVVAGFYPVAFAAEQVAGPETDVVNLTPPGVEPHDLELSPDDVRQLSSADTVLLLGRDFQPQLERAARSNDGVIELLDSPELSTAGDDPHVWLDPVRYAQLVERIGQALDAPEAAERLAARVRGLDEEYRSGLESCERHEIVTSHAAFGYLAARYGLDQIAITGLSPEAEAAPQDLELVVQQIRETGATTVYSETLVSPKLARAVARETGARTDVLDPIEGLTQKSLDAGADYFSVMRDNLRRLKRGLGCR